MVSSGLAVVGGHRPTWNKSMLYLEKRFVDLCAINDDGEEHGSACWAVEIRSDHVNCNVV